MYLTGVYAEQLWHGKVAKQEVWNKYFQAEDRNQIISAGCSSKENGLYPGHAYSLLSVHSIEHCGKTVQLVKLRNPWGRKEWTGAWSDKSQEWNDASDHVKKDLEWSDADDRIFFMPFDSFLSAFPTSHISVDFDPDVYQHNRVLCDFNCKKYQFYSFELYEAIDLTKETLAIFCSQQGNCLKMSNHRTQKEFMRQDIGTVLIADDGTFIGLTTKENYRGLQATVAKTENDMIMPGKYYIFVDAMMENNTSKVADYKMVITDVYCKQSVNIKEVSDEKGL